METSVSTQRAYHRKSLHELYLPLYDAICKELPDEWQPYISGRTLAQQNALFAQGRTSPGRIVTEANGRESAHNYYCATDWTKWKDKKPIWIEKPDPRDPEQFKRTMLEWKPYLDACMNAGLRCGADWGDYYHNELKISVRWKKINAIRLKSGDEAAQLAIKENLVKSA